VSRFISHIRLLIQIELFLPDSTPLANHPAFRSILPEIVPENFSFRRRIEKLLMWFAKYHWAFEPKKHIIPKQVMEQNKTLMKNALNHIVVPELRIMGFKGSLPHFRRISGKVIDLLTFQFDKYGGGFVIEVGQTRNESFTTHWGKEIPTSKLTAHHLNPIQRTRIHPKGLLENSSPED